MQCKKWRPTKALSAALKGNEWNALWAGHGGMGRALIQHLCLRKHQRPSLALEGPGAKGSRGRLQCSHQGRNNDHLRKGARQPYAYKIWLAGTLRIASDQLRTRDCQLFAHSLAGRLYMVLYVSETLISPSVFQRTWTSM